MTRAVRLVTLGLLAVVLLHIPQTPVRACSCASPFDLQTAIDESEAAFVGTLIDKRADTVEWESTYVFEVERWVKGDAGSVIEVRSATDGAGCGFEFPADQRIGALIRVEGGELHGGLCSQVDADALLAASGGNGKEGIRPSGTPETTTTFTQGSTTPPLVAPELDVAESPSAGLQWLAGSALVLFVAGLVWLARPPG